MDTGLRGKTALITAGSTGIGFGIAKALAEEGVDLALAGLEIDQDAIETLRGAGVTAVPIQADVSQEEQVIAMVQTAIHCLGSLDLYVNCAAWAWHEPITRLTTEAWRKTIDTNLTACGWACREISRHMVERRQGSILIIGSTSMFTPMYRETAYRISKTGLKIMMEVLALELAPYGIRVNMIVPGHFMTRLTAGCTGEPLQKLIGSIPLQRTGRTEEVGPAAILLLSDKLSGYTTGTFLLIDGGLHLHPIPILSRDDIFNMNAPGAS